MDLSGYTLQPLREDGERILYRGMPDASRPSVLVAAMSGEYASPAALARLHNEYALAAELDPRWAAQPVALVRHRGRTLLVLNDPGGEPLDGLLGKPLEPGAFLRLAVSLARAVASMHAAGLIHKDIKPAHVLVDPASGDLRLTGFGIASRLRRERQAPAPAELIAGTLPYMAPEQTGRMNRSIDSRSDLYALGVTLYELLTGSLPFTASDPMQWVHCHIARRPMPPAERVKETPATISAIIMKLLAKTAEDRYQTAAGLESDLRRCLAAWDARRRVGDFPLGEHDTPDRVLIPEKLYGREHEIQALLAAFDRVVKRGAAELVLVSGYSGIGKSSVVNELQKTLVPSHGIFASGKFDQYKRDIPYSTLAQAFQSLIRPLLAKSEADLAPWRDALLEALGPNARLMVDLVPELTLLIGDQPPVADLPPQQAQGRFQLVFRRFIGVFARPDHPLALFLDDLQWLDAATLDLLQDLLSHGDVRHLLLIGAYRENEIDAAHPLMHRVEAIRNEGGKVEEITLAPLAHEHLGQLIADTLHCEPRPAAPLTQLVHGKTAGNPFFVIQFLYALAEEHLLAFDHGSSRWTWNLERIRAKSYTDNVVDLLVSKLVRLPAETQAALQRLACLGNATEVTTLALVLGTSQADVDAALREAVRQELVEHREGSYRFIHDRVQEAAYSTITEALRAEAHLGIGRLLAANIPAERREDHIFDIVNQLNRGAALITEPEEREQVAELNLIAGERAKAASAYASALAYLTAGAALLPEGAWERRHELAFALERGRAECEFLTGDLIAAEQRLNALSNRAERTVERASVVCLCIDLYTTLGQNARAIDAGRDCLRPLGIDWPPHPTDEEARREYDRIWSQLGSRPIEELIDLPTMTDPASLATLDVLTKVFAAAMYTEGNFACLVICRAVNLSLERGNCDGSTFAYVMLGAIAGARFGDYKAGLRFGQLGYELVEQRRLRGFQARVYNQFGTHVLPWTRHVKASRDLLRRAFEVANRNGDLTFSAYSCHALTTNLLAAGDPLPEVQREAEHGLAFAKKSRFRVVIDLITIQVGLIRTLRGLTPKFGSFDDGQFDELRIERHLAGNPGLARAEFSYWTRKAQARFLAGDYPSAVTAASRAESLLWLVRFAVEAAEYYFYAALSRAASCDSMPPDRQVPHRQALAALHGQLEAWAQNCPENFEHRAALVGAEIARIEGRDVEAMRLYEQAIGSARANGFVQNEAISCELAAKFYAARGFAQIAQLYLRSARHGYLSWGADGKVKQLDERVAPPREEPASPPAISLTDVAHLDLLSVAKASQAISGQIVLEDLVETLMRIVLESAGAQTGHLLLARSESLVPAAEASFEQQRLHVRLQLGQQRQDEEPREAALPASIVNYVRRSKERVLLADAAQSNPFSTDDYFSRRQPKSVLCLPILRQSALIGLLYLENNLATHAFTSERLTVLELLASQAAISLENALLYEDLRRSEAYLADAQGLTHTGSWAWSVARRQMIYRSAEAYRIFGFDPATDSPDIEAFRDRVHPKDRERHAAAFRGAIKTKSDFELDFRVVLPDGSVNYAHTVGHPVFDAGGNVVELVGTTVNVTEQHHARAALEMALEDLREREVRIRRLVESNIIGVFFWDVAGGITDANDAFLQSVGYSRQDVLSGNVSWSSITPPEYHAADQKAIEEAIQSGTCQSYEKEFIRSDGRRTAVLIGGAIIEGSKGQGVSFVLDLTERKQAEAERGARQAAEMANRAKSEFLARMSHELRTPLTGILGYAEILRGDRTLTERQLHGVGVIRQGGEHLLTLINDILDFARIEAGKLELSVTEIPMANFLRVIADIIGVRAEQKQLAFRCDIAADLPLGVLADERRLRQVLLNLLANAVKFTDRGEVSLTASFSPPGRLRFEVRDTGVGISKDRWEAIFQPFEQAGGMHHRFGGTGLGLAISRQLVRLMGSDIEMRSRPGEGSAFWFEVNLPVVQAHTAAAISQSVVTGYAGPRRKILVVDDVPANRMLLGDLLAPLGFEITGAASGGEGLDIAESLRPDLILMDSVMPGIDGLEATRRLRRVPGLEGLPVIAISADASGTNEATALAAGANAFLPKPFNLGTLLAQVGDLLKLQWIREPGESIPVRRDGAPGRLVAPPAQELAVLHRLALLGNMRDIAREAAHLSELDGRYDAFADELKVLAKGYQSRAILRLVEQHLNGGRTP